MQIVIVGGGTAGWLTAAALKHQTDHKVTLIDKGTDDSVGVGEATLLGFREFLTHTCGFNERDFYSAIDASLKAGILFPDWGKKGDEIWHPFSFEDVCDFPFSDIWSLYKKGDIKDLMDFYTISKNNQVAVDYIDSAYALHFDCKKLVEFVQSNIDIKLIRSEVAGVERKGKNIKTLLLEQGEIIKADLFIDCSGQKTVLREEEDGDKIFCDWRLFTNTAVAAHVPYENKDVEFHPYVSCPAVDHGWIWKIPLGSSIGTGLVFNRDITGIDEAKKYLSEYYNNRITPDDMKVLKWRPYYESEQWYGNTVNIGLSAGFIEPLESTGIALIIRSINSLIPKLGTDQQEAHNMEMEKCWEQAIDFVRMHYAKSDIDSKFWKFVRFHYSDSELMKLHLENMDSQNPSMKIAEFIGTQNWIHWLIQLGYPIQPKKYVGMSWTMNNRRYWSIDDIIKVSKGRSIKTLPHILWNSSIG